MRRTMVGGIAGVLLLAGCGGGDGIEAIAADACDAMVAAAEDQDPQAFQEAVSEAEERAAEEVGDDEEAQQELIEAFEDACPELEELLREGFQP